MLSIYSMVGTATHPFPALVWGPVHSRRLQIQIFEPRMSVLNGPREMGERCGS